MSAEEVMIQELIQELWIGMQWIGRQLEIKTKVIATQHGTTKALILSNP
jgi:hypothetical protein